MQYVVKSLAARSGPSTHGSNPEIERDPNGRSKESPLRSEVASFCIGDSAQRRCFPPCLGGRIPVLEMAKA